MAPTIKSNNPEGGFLGTIKSKMGEAKAERVWGFSVHEIKKAVPDATLFEVREFLDSYYGARAGEALLGGTSVKDQIQDRPERFLKKFNRVRRSVTA